MDALLEAAPPLSKKARLRDLASLAKPRLSSLVMVTAGGAMYLAPEVLAPWRVVLTLLATATLVGAANALNCWSERDVDAVMLRTRTRPLPARRLEPQVALWLGWGGAAVSLPSLAVASNLLTALLGAVAFLSYVFVYTPMKRVSPAALLVGAVPGAMPPLMGWTAATGRLDVHGLALFALLFAWQLPHFLAIALYLRDDYERAQLRIFSYVYGERATRRAIALSSLLLVPVTLLPWVLGMAGTPYLAAALGLGAVFSALASTRRWARDLEAWARGVFLGSTIYLTLLFAALMLGAR